MKQANGTGEGRVKIPKRRVTLFISGILTCFILIIAIIAGLLQYAAAQPATLTSKIIREHESAYVQNMPSTWTCTLRTGSTATGTGAQTSTVTCSGSEKVISGGCYLEYNSAEQNRIDQHYSRPTDQGWECQARELGGASVTAIAYANCCT